MNLDNKGSALCISGAILVSFFHFSTIYYILERNIYASVGYFEALIDSYGVIPYLVGVIFLIEGIALILTERSIIGRMVNMFKDK